MEEIKDMDLRHLLLAAFFILVCVFNTLSSASESPDIGDLQVFPDDNPWNWDISSYPVHPNSDNFIESIGPQVTLHPDFGTVWNGAPIGIPYTVVTQEQAEVDVVYTAYGDESDAGPFPIPLGAPIEGGTDSDGDRHVIAVTVENGMLYELYRAFSVAGSWQAESGAVFDLKANELRPEGWTSADAAGLPIFPGLVRYEEVYVDKEIDHALRFTVQRTQKKYIWPARHYASSSTDPNRPPMGLRFRLKADFDLSGFSEPIQVILKALEKYGMIVADNGSNWYISGAPDDRWDDDVLGELKTIAGSNFEAVQTVNAEGEPIYPIGASVRATGKPENALLIRHYPNPFNASTTIEYSLPESGNVNLKVFNLLGQEIAVLFQGFQQAGEYQLKWTPTELASGIYFYRFQSAGVVKVGKLIIQE